MTNLSLRLCDYLDGLRSLPDESVDLIITDPPYESLEKHRAKGTTTRLKMSDASNNPWFPVMKNEAFPRLMIELYRVLKPNSHCYVFCDGETSDVLRDVIRLQNQQSPRNSFTWWKRIVWDKMKIGMGYHYRGRHEFIVFLEKGKRTLIMQSSKEGDTILDPFMGSGSTGVAAHNELRSFIGFDINPKAYELANVRVC